jgi:hypothetical protein
VADPGCPEGTASCTYCRAVVPAGAYEEHGRWHTRLVDQLSARLSEAQETSQGLRNLTRQLEQVAEHQAMFGPGRGLLGEADAGEQLPEPGLRCEQCEGDTFTLQLGGRHSGQISCNHCGAVLAGPR